MQTFRTPHLYLCKQIKRQTIMSKKQNPKRKAQFAELDALCEKGLAEEMFTLRDIVEGVRNELECQTEAGKGSLEGTIVPFLLGITTTCPNSSQPNNSLTRAENIQLPLQVVLYYDNEIRNRVVDWVKARYEGVTTRLGQPVLKRPNMVIEFKRVVKS